MNMTIEALQQQILSSSGELFNSSNINSIGVYNGLSADALSQLFRSSQDYMQNDTTSSSSAPTTNPGNQYQFGELFHNSQVFKGFPEGLYTYLNTKGEDTERSSTTPASGLDSSKFLKWMSTLEHQTADPRQRSSGDQAIPLSYSPTDDHMGYVNPQSNVGVVPSMSGATNAQGTIILESASPDPQINKKRAPEVHLIESDKAVKKKRRQEKNREAAQLFRQRQKTKVHELEKTVDDLTCNNSEYRMKMEILAFENKILKDQLFYLKNLVSSGILITSMPNVPGFPQPQGAAPPLDKAEGLGLLLNNIPSIGGVARSSSPVQATSSTTSLTMNGRSVPVATGSTLPPKGISSPVGNLLSNARTLTATPSSNTSSLMGTTLPISTAASTPVSVNINLSHQPSTSAFGTNNLPGAPNTSRVVQPPSTGTSASPPNTPSPSNQPTAQLKPEENRKVPPPLPAS